MERNVITKITRHRPDTCNGCIIEYETDYDSETGLPVSEPKFLLMNSVCEEHKPLASAKFKPNHVQLSAHATNLIEQIKARNLKQLDDRAQKITRHSQLQDLERLRAQIERHNDKITEEWNELASQPHAFDSHIHDQIRREQLSRPASRTKPSALLTK